MIEAKMSHGGVALYDAATHRLLRWLLMSSGTPTEVGVEGDDVTVTFADGERTVYDLATGTEQAPHPRAAAVGAADPGRAED